MKKCTKILLAGAGIISVGLIAYELMRKPEETVTTVNEMKETADHIQATGTPSSTSTQEFIERRKMRAAEKRVQRMEVQEQAFATVIGEAETETVEPIAEDTAAVTVQGLSANPENITDRKEQEKSEAVEDTQPLVPESQRVEEVSAAEDSEESK